MNTIVETIIGDWNFFFDGDVNFYVTMSRDKLFPDNGGFPIDKDQSVIHIKPDAGFGNPMSVSMMVENPKPPKMSHSRSSSHDTSLILLNDQMKSSRSNSSLSDVSPTTGSPKLPTRRKPKAPVPPMSTPQPAKPKLEAKVSLPMSVSKLHDTSSFSYIDSDPLLHVDEARGNMKKAGSIDNILSKPDRPPRPVLANAESQTLSRAVVRQVPLKDKSSGPARPVAAPRTTLMKGEFDKSEENLVLMREKPAIPDRPVTLMRPASFRAATGGMSSPTSILTNDKLVEELSATFKAGSSAHPSTVRRNNSMREGKTSESSANGEVPQSKHVTMYTVDKQQVAIVDLPPSGSPHPTRRQLFISESDNKENSQNLNLKSELSGSTDALADDSGQPPQSPRDVKVKRPQVPPPARPRSSDGSGDSTNL